MRYIILILYISTCQLSAESLEKAEELEPITVTATRFNELVNDVPHDVHLIDEIDILQLFNQNKNHKSLNFKNTWGFTTYSDRFRCF